VGAASSRDQLGNKQWLIAAGSRSHNFLINYAILFDPKCFSVPQSATPKFQYFLRVDGS
jgi:hypothetical protein